MADRLEQARAAGGDFDAAVMAIVREQVIATKAIRFEGNGYSDEWREEAARRGLLNLAKTPEALAQLKEPVVRELYAKAGVYGHDELESRYHLEVERYIKDLEIEVNAIDELATAFVLPAAYRHQQALASSIDAVAEVLDDDDPLLEPQVAELRATVGLIAALKGALSGLRAAAASASGLELEASAAAFAEHVAPALVAVRDACDAIEATVDDALWPLPKYREMLFAV
jgi:glutamine synthetase